MNNFGFGGSNAHFILEQAPRSANCPSSASCNGTHGGRFEQKLNEMIVPQGDLGKSRRVIVLSAANENSLRAQVRSLTHYLKHKPEVLYRSIFSSLALTLQRRSLHQWRIAISATSQAGTFEALDENHAVPIRSTREPKIGFIFTGQGAQW